MEVTYVPLPDEVKEIISIHPVTNFELVGAYPNPFNGTTVLQFTLQRPEPVIVEVFNMTGQRVTSAPTQLYLAGSHNLPLELAGIASGQYIVAVRTPSDLRTTRITLIQ